MWNLRVFAIISSGGQHRYQPTPDENVTSRERVITLMLRGSTFPLVIIKEDILVPHAENISSSAGGMRPASFGPDSGSGSRRHNSRLWAADNIGHDGPDFLG
jgi:hypothetical protein